MDSKLKDVFADVYKTCPQDEMALCEIIASILNNENIYKSDDNVNRLLGLSHENILIDGDFGIGKTTMVEEVAKVLNIPFYKFPFSKVNDEVVWNLLVGNFRDIFTMMYRKNHNPRLHGVIVIEEMERILDDDSLIVLDGIIDFDDFKIYDDDLKENVTLDISNITFVGEVNRNRAMDYVSVPDFNISFLSKTNTQDNSDETKTEVQDDEIKKISQKALIDFAKMKLLERKIDYIENSAVMWHVFQKHIKFEKIDKDSIKIILRDSYISKYKALVSSLGVDDYLSFFDDKLLDGLAELLAEDYNKLYSVPSCFQEILRIKMDNGSIDMFPLSRQKKKKM